jgi:hypothetical protein
VIIRKYGAALAEGEAGARPLLCQCLFKEPFVGLLLRAHNLEVFTPEVRAQWSQPYALALPYNAHRDDEENDGYLFSGSPQNQVFGGRGLNAGP